MRRVLYIVLALLTGCGGGSWLQRPVLPDTGSAAQTRPQWLQEGGDAQRSYPVAEAETALSGDKAGIESWSFSLDGTSGRAAPLFADGVIFFSSSTSVVEAVNLATGEKIGQFSCELVIHATPAISAGRLYVATLGAESPLLCFSLTDGSLEWRRVIEPVEAGLCVHDGAVFAGGLRGGVYRFDPSDSVETWRTTVDAPIRAAPGAVDSVLVVATSAGDVIGLHTRDGSRLWRIPMLEAVLATPVISGRNVLVVDRRGTLICADAYTGHVRWRAETQVQTYHSPIVLGHRVCLPTASGELRILDLETGSELGTLDSGELPAATPLPYAGVLLQLTRKGELVALDLQHGGVKSIHELPRRSETPPLIVPGGVILVDEQGEAVLLPLPEALVGKQSGEHKSLDGTVR